MRLLRIAALVAASAGAPAAADPCRAVSFEEIPFTVCEAGAGDDLRLFLRGADGLPLGGFERIDRMLSAEGARLAFAMNGGMYHPDRSPVGAHVERGVAMRAPVTRAGPGNFGMLPNGVFCIFAQGAAPRFAIFETAEYVSRAPACLDATQSGPMLVIDGALHPRFIPGSASRYLRNGVGVDAAGGRAVLAISDAPVNFDTFARFFRDVLGLPRALYLDGKISRLHAPGLGRSDAGWPMGPVLGLVVPR